MGHRVWRGCVPEDYGSHVAISPSGLTEEEEQEAQYLGRNEPIRRQPSSHVPADYLPDRLIALLAESWSGAEWPAQFATAAGLDTGGIVRMFMHAGFVTADPDRPRPSAPIRIYRGCTDMGVAGFSWTTGPETARWFAKRFADLGVIDPEDDGEQRVIVSAMVDPWWCHSGREHLQPAPLTPRP